MKHIRLKKLLIWGVPGVIIFAGILSILYPTIIISFTRHTEFFKDRIEEDKRPVRKVTQEGKVETIGQGTDAIKVLYLKGTPYEMGYQHGQLLKDDIRECVNSILDDCYRLLSAELRISSAVEIATNFTLDEAYKRMEPFIPEEDKEEMQGLADGSGIPIADIHRIHAIPDLGESSCSAIAAFGKATSDGNLYQVRILDYSMEFKIQDYPIIIVYQPDTGHPFANISWAGFIGVVSGMNTEGVAVSEVGYGSPGKDLPGIPEPQPEETIEGLPMPFLLKQILRYADNVDQATGIMKGVKRTNYFVFVVGDGITEDGIPEARGYITTKDFCKVYVDDDPDYPIPALDDIIYASDKNEICYDLLGNLYGNIDPFILMEEIIPAISLESNLQCVVYDTHGLKLWVANAEGLEGRACEQGYVAFDLGGALKVK